MAKVDTSNGTYLSALFDPEVVGSMINEKLIPNIVFAPLAVMDYTLQGRAGDTVKLPYYEYIGDAETVNEGEDIPLKKLSQKTKSVKITKLGRAIQITDEAVLSGYGDPIGEGVSQIVTSIASGVDKALLTALDGNSNTYAFTSGFNPDEIPTALAKFGEEINVGSRAIIVNPDAYAKLLGVKSWVPASDIAASMLINGAVGMAYGCQVIVSERVTENFHIVKPGALALFMKRDTMVETDRDILNQSTVIAGSKLFAPYLYRPKAAIKLTGVAGE